MVSLNGKQKQPPHVRQRGNETEISCNFLDFLGILYDDWKDFRETVQATDSALFRARRAGAFR